MKTIRFFDDWMLDSRTDMVRSFPQPEFVSALDPGFHVAGYANFERNRETKKWQMWYGKPGRRELPGRNWNEILCYAESDDGLTAWKRPDLGFMKEPGLTNAAAFDVVASSHYKVTYDPADSDSSRRYKLPAIDIAGGILDNNIIGLLYVSPDGRGWKLVEKAAWYRGRMGSDTDNNLLYNPVTKRYQIVCRPSCLDRRIAVVESEDLIHWTEPVVVLHPDPFDESLCQFYSMPHFWYNGIFVGFMQIQRVASSEKGGPFKWLGKIDTELTYSYNGIHWNRAGRRPFIDRNALGSLPVEELYTGKMLIEDSGSIRIYSLACDVEHFAGESPEGFERKSSVLVHRLREDGFCCLEPKSGYGYLATRCILPKDDQLRLNYLAPKGKIWCQVSDQNYQPLPGFRFEDCLPLTGDEVRGTPRWKTKTLRDLPGKYLALPSGCPAHQSSPDLLNKSPVKYIRLEFRLYQARLYAIHWDCHIKYGDAIIGDIA